ncbi:MAG: streptogramin lyase [Betaproteobacteria bacterium]|nr:streptogramin lyase [Betaproteobacteria bacterium]
MTLDHLFRGAVRRALLCLLLAPALAFAADEPVALQGDVSSAEEGKMEGVVVSAKRADSTISVSVVSDAKGHYRFPRGRLAAGDYGIVIRAVGYDLEQPVTAAVGGKPARADLRLKKAADRVSQMTNAELMVSMPGSERDKRNLLVCVTCHTLQRVIHSKYSAEQFTTIILPRMQRYVNQSMPGAPQVRKGERVMEERGEDRIEIYKEMGAFLASINLHDRDNWTYEVKPFARPTGAATKVIYTEYDLPRPLIQPHDVVLDSKGMVWYSNFGEQNIGRVDPKTGAVKEFNVGISKPEFPTGILALRNDREGKLWLGNMYQASIARFDPATEKFNFYRPAKEDDLPSTQLNQVAAMNSGVDGKVWAQNSGFAGVHRFDLATGKVETWAPFKDTGTVHNIYDVISDSHNNAFFTDFRQQEIGRIDAKTGKVTLYTIPTKGASPRRGSMDDRDRLWFGEYRGHKIGMLDTKTEDIKEWTVPTPFSAPYDVVLDRTDHAWTGSMTTDRVARLDIKTGKFTEYLLPRETNIRRVFVDDTTPRPTFWVGSNHGASIVKLETLQ